MAREPSNNGGLELSKVVRARYEKGVLKLLEPIQLEEGRKFWLG